MTAGPERTGANSHFDETEGRHLERVLRREQSFATFTVLDVVVAAALAVYWTWSGSWSGARCALIVLLLLGARAHLSQLRSARLLRKLTRPGEVA